MTTPETELTRASAQKRFDVPREKAGQRLDVFLADCLGWSRKQVAAAVKLGAATVDGFPAAKGTILATGDAVVWSGPATPSDHVVPDADAPVTVLYEDERMVVLAKPPGVHCVPLRPGERRAVANFLAARFPDSTGVGSREGDHGLVNRIDEGTSGIVLAARDAAAHEQLRTQIARGTAGKRYLAIVHGRPPRTGKITYPILPHGPKGQRLRAVYPGERVPGRAVKAVTRFQQKEAFDAHTLVDVRLITGVRHQIRVHLASDGFPIVGDRLYGREVAGSGLAAKRPMLHAWKLSVDHPGSGKRVEVTCPPPDDFRHVLDSLRADGDAADR